MHFCRVTLAVSFRTRRRGFFVGQDGHAIHLLGGNQGKVGGKVSEMGYALTASDVKAYRLP